MPDQSSQMPPPNEAAEELARKRATDLSWTVSPEGSAAQDPIESVVLPNGLTVEFGRTSEADLAEVVVCSGPAAPDQPTSARYVFERLGIPESRLEEFEPPSKLFETEADQHALLVRTTGEGRSWSSLAESLRDGVQPLVLPDGIRTLGISPENLDLESLELDDALRVCLYTLGSLNGVGRFRVLFSLPDQYAPPSELAGWTQTEAPLSLPHERLEPHVALALRLAQVRAGGDPIDARHVVEGLLGAAPVVQSSAFETLANFLSASTPSVGKDDLKTTIDDDLQLWVSSHLAVSFLGIPDYMRADGGRIWGRDLVSLVLLSRDPSLEAVANASGTSVASLRDRWLGYVLADEKTRRPKEDWLAWWRDCGFRTDAIVRRSGYLPELLQTEDKLNIEGEAEAFAGLMCDESVAPPLSIALLGDWGSGKSFFMNKIKSKVESNNGRPGYCDNAVAIEFNAWHMSDANLWASLVDHIFQELRKAMVGEKKAEEFSKELARAEGAVHVAQLQLDQATEDLGSAQAELTRATQEIRKAKIGKQLEKAAKALGLGGVCESILDVEQAAKELNDATEESRKVLSAALQPRSLGTGLCWVAASVLVGAAVVTIGPMLPLEDLALKEQIDSALRTLGTIGGVVGSIIGGIAGSMRKGAGLVREFNQRVRDELDDYQKKLEDPSSELVETRAEYEQAKARLRAAQANLQRIEAGGGAQDVARNLRRFIEERAQSEDYRARQGLISLVRRDFEKLAWMMNRMREAKKSPGEYPPATMEKWRQETKLVDRVVLYIDDLDRCKPKRVVEVLEAVHLLLGLDLFVVVVAVDSRWMLRALQVHYQDLLSAKGEMDGAGFRESTPQNYLEKIFQIPFALAPMSKAGFEQYVHFLVKDGAERVRDIEPERESDPAPDVTTEGESTATTTDPDEADESTPDLDDEERIGSTEDEVEQQAETEEAPATWGQYVPEEDTPRIVVITRAEREVMEQLGPLLPTPRQAKRLVNVFRLLKLQIDEKRLASFERPNVGGHRAVLVLLAILFGRPHLAHSLFREIYELDASPSEKTLCQFLESWATGLAPSAEDSNRALAEEARQARETLRTHHESVKLKDCAAWVGVASRYSLVTGQEWHTWVEGPLAIEAAKAARG
jgi:hypothetical protein